MEKNTRVIVGILVGVVLVVALGILVQKHYNVTVTPAAEPVPVTDEAVVWLPAPEELKEDLRLFTLEAEIDREGEAATTRYYKLGMDNGKDVLLAIAPALDPSGERHIMLREEGETYNLLVNHSDVYYEGTYGGPTYSKLVKEDFETAYRALQPPDNLSVPEGQLERAYNLYNHYFFSDYETPGPEEEIIMTEFASTPWGPLYSHVIVRTADGPPDNGKVKIQQFILKLTNGAAAAYQSRPEFVSDDNVPLITWNDGAKNVHPYAWNSLGGCGAPGYVVVLDSGTPGLVPAGKTATGELVYGFSNPETSVVKQYYDGLPEGKYYFYNNETGESEQIPISLQEYADHHGVFVYKDSFERSIVFVNQYYGNGAECGKPVIYLYPEVPTPVHVEVSAHITESDPAYGQGWDVMASPDGTLVTGKGDTYHSLFWEGQGKGFYPTVAAGFVVPRSEIESTLSQHIRKLGLNDRESQEFMDFWLPKMPNTPYVRLTWFGTRQMNELAPLSITPAPDTLIRIFLDFEGLQEPIVLPAQTLSVAPRGGFTVVEWGGLLRDRPE